MTIFQIEVRAKAESHDVQAHRLAREIVFLPQASLPSLNAIATSPHPLTIHTTQLYRLTGNLSPHNIHRLITELLTDPVIQEAQSTGSTTDIAGTPETSTQFHTVDVFLLPGVTDTLAESVIAGAHMLGITGLEQVATGRRYLLDSRLSQTDVETIAEALLYNPVIQHYTLHTTMAEQQTTGPIESLESLESTAPLASSIPISNRRTTA